MPNTNELPPPAEQTDETEAATWIFALPGDSYQQLVDGYEEARLTDPGSPLAGFLEAWIEIERGKQSLLELFT